MAESDDPADPGVVAHRRALAGETISYERVLDGRSLEVRVDPMRDEDGAIVGCIAVAVEFARWRTPPSQAAASGGSRSA